MNRWILFALGLLSLLLLAGCGPAAEEIASTVASQVAAAVQATVAAAPTVTAYPTYTPQATLEPYPTHTPYATHTPYPTDTPYPTYTPFPTLPAPTETPVPTNTATRQAAAPPTATRADVGSTLLAAMKDTRGDIESFGGLIDVALREGFVDCQEVVDFYDGVAASPTFDVSGSSGLVQGAYGSYRAAIDIFTTGARDMTQNCRDFLANPSGGTIPFQQWGLARLKVNDALNVLIPAIDSLEG
ncbi:MAG: hypothetical protein AB1791_03030 [Chloroflexota bacterium]